MDKRNSNTTKMKKTTRTLEGFRGSGSSSKPKGKLAILIKYYERLYSLTITPVEDIKLSFRF